MSEKKQLFDQAAEHYDASFTYSTIGKKQRERVYFWLDHFDFFKKIERVFEINCGTGYDAEQFTKKGLKVTATDASEKMILEAKKTRSSEINFFQLNFEKIDQVEDISNAIFSNFGGLNCISQEALHDLTNRLAKKQKQGELLVWVIMPKFCLMESLYFLSRFQFGKIFRRNTRKAIPVDVDGTPVNTFYHSPKTLKKMLQPDYNIHLKKPVALFLPPSYLEPFFSKRQRLLNFLNRLERFFGQFSLFSGAADHYILIAERK